MLAAWLPWDDKRNASNEQSELNDLYRRRYMADLKIILAGFIGIAINIWRDTQGTGGGGFPADAIRQRDGDIIIQRDGQFIQLRS
mgnify:CR=1 FL=1